MLTLSRYLYSAVKVDQFFKLVRKAAVLLLRNDGARHEGTLGFRELKGWKSKTAYDITRMGHRSFKNGCQVS